MSMPRRSSLAKATKKTTAKNVFDLGAPCVFARNLIFGISGSRVVPARESALLTRNN
jgi:hypothetical protein